MEVGFLAAKDLMSQDLKNSVAAWYAVCFNLARSARCLRYPINPGRCLCRCAPPSNFLFDQ